MKSITQVVQNLLKPYIDNHRQTFESNIAPVETDATSASRSYSKGQQLVLNDVLYDVTASIAADDPLSTTGAGANIAAADTISNDINKLRKRNFILIGDSFAYGVDPTHDSSTGVGWIKHFINTVGAETGCNVYYANVSVLPGVAGFASSLTFLSMIQSLSNTITDKDSITDIIVLGGSNDVSANGVTGAAIVSGIENFCEYCRSNYRNAKIKIGILSSRLRLMCSDSAYTMECYKESTTFGADYIGDAINLYTNPDYISSDNTHLTQAGYEHYTKVLNELILSGHCNYNEKYAVTLTLDTTKVQIGDSSTEGIAIDVSYNRSGFRFSIRNTNRYNSGALKVVDRSLTGNNSIANFASLNKKIELPEQYNNIAGGDIIILKNDNTVANIGGAYRIFTADYTSLSLQLSGSIGNWHVNDSTYSTICMFNPSLPSVILN